MDIEMDLIEMVAARRVTVGGPDGIRFLEGVTTLAKELAAARAVVEAVRAMSEAYALHGPRSAESDGHNERVAIALRAYDEACK